VTKTVGFLTDFHSPNHDEEAIGIAVDNCKYKKVDTVIISELPELRTVSYWNKNEGELEWELEETRVLVEYLSKEFKKQEIIYIPGNHDERLDSYLRTSAPALRGLRGMSVYELTDMKKHGWIYHDNKLALQNGDGPLFIGRLCFLHGHEVKTGWGAVNLAKIFYDRCRSNVMFGHHHRCQEWIVRKINGEHEGSWGVGCLCELNPKFMPHNDWVHGFSIIKFYDDTFFKVKNRKIISGRVL
jgi:predicted phosphodiesterase